MDTNAHELPRESAGLILKNEVYQVVGCALNVLKGLGHGLHEKIYENALAVEFKLREIPHFQQRRFDVFYRGVQVGQFVPDLIAYDAMIVDTKTVDRISDHERGQMLNYLRITKLRLGVIFNFKHAKLEHERIIL